MNWCFWTVGLGKTLRSPLGSKEIQPVNPKENQPWIFIWRTDAEAPILCPHMWRAKLIGKDPDAGKDWRQEEKGTTEDEMVGWHHRLNCKLSLSKIRELVMDRKPGVLQSIASQRVGHDWVTELNWLSSPEFCNWLIRPSNSQHGAPDFCLLLSTLGQVNSSKTWEKKWTWA